MNTRLYTVLILIASALMLASAVIALRSRPHFRQTGGKAESRSECGIDGGGLVEPDEPDRASDSRSAMNRDKPGKTLAERDKAKYDVGEMRNEAEEWIRKFRGTPEERREIIEECRNGVELLRTITDITVESYESMTHEELEKARNEFESNYRAQLDYLQSGKLQRMLKTPEEQEVIGAAFEAAQDFLERLDDALHAAGY